MNNNKKANTTQMKEQTGNTEVQIKRIQNNNSKDDQKP